MPTHCPFRSDCVEDLGCGRLPNRLVEEKGIAAHIPNSGLGIRADLE
jgi:hypothetical protein